MATVEQIKQEILDYFNSEVRKHNEKPAEERYHYEMEEAEDFDQAFGGIDDVGVYDELSYEDGVELPSGRAKSVKKWGDGDYGVTLVFSVGEQFFKITGSYSSWDGHDWYGKLVEVFPKEEVKIRYYEKKD
jgi:hypothetical protein